MCWLEFKTTDGDTQNKVSVRTYQLCSVEGTGTDSCRLYLDDEHHYSYSVAESYDEVMKRIKEAEEPVAIPVAERFTREEFTLIQSMILMATSEVHIKQADSKTIKLLESINNKVSEILKEDD